MADLEVRCRECDAILEDSELMSYGAGNRSVALFVNPCKKCADDARAEGYDHGKEDADKKTLIKGE